MAKTIKRALVSVSDKSGIVEFCKKLKDMGIGIISTGGTAKTLQNEGIDVIGISDITGFPECLDGRVKTLHPRVHAGILAIRDNKEHMQQLASLGIDTIDMIVINLYPFKQTILKPDVTLEEAIENIDIGGPTMLRSAAKNFQDVVVIVDPGDYDRVLEEIGKCGEVSVKTKMELACKVFQHTSNYDAMIAEYLTKKAGMDSMTDTLTLTFEKVQEMRYGENPHQKAAFYKEVVPVRGSIAFAQQLQGKELSYNNINDADSAVALIKEFDVPAVVAVKHANPCGAACGDDIYEAYIRAYEADPVSIFGGIVAANREIDARTAEEMCKIFLEIVIAPSFTAEALEVFAKKKNLRVLKLADIDTPVPEGTLEIKKVLGGILVQHANTKLFEDDQIKIVTNASPSEKQMQDLIFAMKVVKHTKSNAIVIAKDLQTLGIGPGQTNRITSANIAIHYAKEKASGAVMASDAFFPFSDCVEAAAKAGIKAIIQPGGSLRDQDSIDACNKYGIAMVFTGMRHFKH